MVVPTSGLVGGAKILGSEKRQLAKFRFPKLIPRIFLPIGWRFRFQKSLFFGLADDLTKLTTPHLAQCASRDGVDTHRSSNALKAYHHGV